MRTRPRTFRATCALFMVGLCGLSVLPAKAVDPTKIVLLGTIHGSHQQNPRYSLDILRDLIVKLKPAAILVELPPTIGGQLTVEEQRIIKSLAVDENKSANAAADLLQIPVIPYDREGRNELYKQTKYFDRQTQLSRRIDSWLDNAENRTAAPAETAVLGPLSEDASRSQQYFDLNAGPEIINSEGYDRLIRLKHFLFRKLMPELSTRVESLRDLAPEFAFFRDEWNERNRIMAENIVKQASRYSGRRLVVLCGSEHRYVLRDLLSTQRDLLLREFYEEVPTRP